MRASILTKLAAIATALAYAGPALGGLDTIVRFTNLSPYAATVEFAAGDSDCWHDAGGQDGRVQEYFDYYRTNTVSETAYKDFLAAFKAATGISSLATVPAHTMHGTAAHLAPGVVGEKADQALFIGETSADLFSGCKLATSSRAFSVALTDSDGTLLSRQRYLVQDPPDDRWTLSRMSPTRPTVKDSTIVLGAGGHGRPLEIALTAAFAAVTLVTLGTAAAELVAARVGIARTVAYIELRGDVPSAMSRQWFDYVLRGGLSYSSPGVAWAGSRKGLSVAWSVAARVLYAVVIDGAIVVYEIHRDADPAPWPAGSVLDERNLGIDFSSPSLLLNGALPADRSICIYETSTFGITECRLAGIDLTIMPDGSLVFVPLPAVGSGK